MGLGAEFSERYFAQSFSRRVLEKATVAAVIGGLAYGVDTQKDRIATSFDCAVERNRNFPDRYSGIKEYEKDFPPDEELKQILLNSAKVEKIEYISSDLFSEGSEVLFKGRININNPKYLILVAHGQTDQHFRFQAAGVNWDDADHILPISETPEGDVALMTLYDVESGEHEIKISATPYSEGISGEMLHPELYAVESDNILYNSIIRLIPRLHIREDNLTEFRDNCPIGNPWTIGMNTEQESLVKFLADLTGQKTGTDYCRAPKPDDRETIAFARYSPDYKLKKRVTQKGKHHEVEEYDPEEYPGVDTQIDTLNNVPSLIIRTNLMTALFEDFLPMSPQRAHQRYLAKKIFAFRERGRKGELDKNHDMLNKFINEELGGVDLIREYLYH